MSLENIVPIQTQFPSLESYLKKLADGVEIQIDYLPEFNKKIFGFERKKLVVVGARPNEGKSLFCLQMAYELSVKFKVLYLSLEMTREEALFRLLCYQQKIPNTDIFSGRYYDYKDIFEKFCEGMNKDRKSVV